MEYTLHAGRRAQHILSAPVIYFGIFPFLFLDAFITVYQATCFPLYGLQKVNRRKYIRVKDRIHLPYLTLMQKINCAYCGYGNGLLQYSVAVAQETQRYWCGIRHKPSPVFHEPVPEKDFLEYGNERAFKALTKKK